MCVVWDCVALPFYELEAGLFYLALSAVTCPSILFLVFVSPCLDLLVPRFIIDTIFVTGAIVSLISLLLCRFCDPGYIKQVDKKEPSKEMENPPKYQVKVNGVSVDISYCAYCHHYRPPRAFHCHDCQRLLFILDLSFFFSLTAIIGVWVNNCIGQRNYNYFVLLLTASTFMPSYTIAVCGWQIVHVWTNAATTPIRTVFSQCPFCCLFIFPAAVLLCLVGPFMCFHFYLMATAQTSHEEMRGLYKSRGNPWAKGLFYNCFTSICPPTYDISPSLQSVSIPTQSM
ncbi:palmitoyltransferase zdhhc9 [Pelomyxa schiedti]|nr:palmitoyltransferase zdhhc9 [Pelomyxa schiedti]